MVEEYEEIADSQYQSERQELFDEDYGKQIFWAFLAIQTALVLLVAHHFLHMMKDLTVNLLVDSVSAFLGFSNNL